MAADPGRRSRPIKSLNVTTRRTVAVPVVNGRVRCPFRPPGLQLAVSDCADCVHGQRVVTDRRGRTWVYCSR